MSSPCGRDVRLDDGRVAEVVGRDGGNLRVRTLRDGEEREIDPAEARWVTL